jgi:hypothetical protein
MVRAAIGTFTNITGSFSLEQAGQNHWISAPPSLDHLDPLFFWSLPSINKPSIHLGGIPRRCQFSSFREHVFQLPFGPSYTEYQIATGLSSLNGAGRRWNRC